MDWKFDDIRRKTAEGSYEAVNYHRFADDMLITVSGHSSKRGWAELALQRLREHLEPLGVELNLEKTRMVNALKGDAFAFLGFDLRRVKKRSGTGYFILMTPKKKARMAAKARIRETIRNGGTKPTQDIVKEINAITGRVGELLPRGERQRRIQRNTRLHGDETSDVANQKETETKK